MTIAGAIVWYDEPPASLERCLRSLVGVVDTLVIADGRWSGFDDDTPVASPDDQVNLVTRFAMSHFDEGVIIDAPELPWASQVVKRDTVYDAASRRANWTLVIDADEYVEHHDRHGLRLELARTDLLTARVASRTLHGPQAGRGVALQPRLFSSANGPLRVQGSHNGVRTAAGDWLTGDPRYVPIVETFDVGDHLRLFHEQGMNRPHERELADRRYRTHRRRNEIEGWPVDPA